MNITNVEYDKLKRIERKYEALLDERDLRPFIKLFADSLAMLAAFTPEKDWPKEFHLAINTAAHKYPELYKLYVQLHKETHST